MTKALNQAAQSLAKLSSGIPKTLSQAQRSYRRKQLDHARRFRWKARKMEDEKPA